MNKEMRIGFSYVILVLTLIFISGCNDSSDPAAQSLYDDLSAKDINVQAMSVIQDSNPQDEEANRTSSQPRAFNIDDQAVVRVQSGENLSVDIAYDAKKDYATGVVFSLDLVEKPGPDSELKVWHIDSGSVEDVPAGAGVLEIETFLPYDIPSGEYVLLGHVLEETNISPENYDIDSDLGIAKLPLHITQPEAPDLEIVEINFAADYMGMSTSPEIDEDGFFVEPNVQASIDAFNGGNEEREVELSLEWQALGKSGTLSLLDENEEIISDVLTITVPPTQEEPYTIPVNAFLSLSDYEALLEDAPDLETSPTAEIPQLTITARIYDPAQNDGHEDDNAVSNELAFLIDDPVDLFFDDGYDIAEADATVESGNAQNRVAYKDDSALKKMLKSLVDGNAIGSNWKNKWGKKSRFAVEPSFKYQVKLGVVPWPRASVTASTGFKAYVLGSTVEVTKLAGSGLLSSVAVGGESLEGGKGTDSSERRYGGTLSFKLFGAKLIDEDKITQTKKKTLLLDANNNVTTDEKAATYKETAKVSKTGTSIAKSWKTHNVLASAKFFIGPVPMSVEGGAAGSLAIQGTFQVSGLNLDARAAIPSTLDGFIKGGIDLVAVKAGVEGTLNLLSIGAVGAGRIGLDAWTGDNGQLKVGIGIRTVAFVGDENAMKIDVFDKTKREKSKISAVRGTLGLYATTKAPKICWTEKSWWKPAIPYPCGFKNNDYKLTLYKSPWLYQKHVPLMNWTPRFELFYVDKDNNIHSSI